MATNATVGKIILTTSLLTFGYYLFWIGVLPFMRIDDGNYIYSVLDVIEDYVRSPFVLMIVFFTDNWIHSYFLPLHYAFIGPVIFGILFVGSIMLYTTYHTKKFPNFFK